MTVEVLGQEQSSAPRPELSRDEVQGAPADTLIARMLVRAEEAPDQTAFEFLWEGGAESISRAALMQRAKAWANLYRHHGLAKGDVVIVVIDHRPSLLYAYLGAMLAGCIPSYMPYSTIKQDRELYVKSHLNLFARIQARAVVTTREWLADFASTLGAQPFKLIFADSSDDLPQEFVAPECSEVALLQHSSGTTALKKGVALSHRAILDQADAYGAAIGIRPDDVIVSWLPLYHDMGLMACFLLPLINGVRVVLLDPFAWVREPHLLFAAIERYSGTLCWLPNFAYHHLCRSVAADAPRYDLSRMRAFINCSEPCKAATFRQFADTFVTMGVRLDQLQTCYAMAENCFAVTQTALGTAARAIEVDREQLVANRVVQPAVPPNPALEFLSCGRIINGVDIRIVDGNGFVLGDGQVGEVAVTGSSLFSGYYRLPDESRRVLRDGWYYTGDLGFVHDGELYITGRIKDLIIIRGRNFYAHDIEYVAGACPGVKPGRAVALGVFNEALGSEDAIVVAERQDDAPIAAPQLAINIKRVLDQQLDLQVRSVHIVEPGWLIKTTSGKISRSENLNKYLAETRATATRSNAPG